MPAPARELAADGFSVCAGTRLAGDVVAELRTVFGGGTRPDFGTGRGRWTLVAWTSMALRTGRGAISSPEASVNNGVLRRLARSPEALAAPAANVSAPDPASSGTTAGPAISHSSSKNVSE